MSLSLGRVVGSAIAAFLKDIDENVDDVEAWVKLARAAECYDRFSRSNLPGFDAGFEEGYSQAIRSYGFQTAAPNTPSL
jgi:hypothetical protein